MHSGSMRTHQLPAPKSSPPPTISSQTAASSGVWRPEPRVLRELGTDTWEFTGFLPQDDCREWQDCREAALTAAQRGEYERFHDLAWRAVQKGPKNDPALMTMLARAQSLSGRPHDALVMLQRLAVLGVATDAAESEDFRRVRALPAWADFQARIAEGAAAKASPVASQPTAPEPAAAAKASEPPAALPKTKPDTPAPPSIRDERKGAEEPAIADVAETLRFATEPFTPAGLAYDAVSNRFIVADRGERKLIVIGERSQRQSNLVGAESGGFGEIGGIAIDVRQGDLWVASTSTDERAGARLHKLQLISGRHLATIPVTPAEAPARFVDVAIAADGAVLALDGLGRRLFRMRPGVLLSSPLERAAELDAPAPKSIAPAAGAILYVAHADGISRVDLQSSTARAVSPSAGVNLAGLTWVRWHRNRLFGVQRQGPDESRIVRIRLDGSGSTATRLEVLERGVSVLGGTSAAIAGDSLYYLTTEPGSGEALQHVVRRIVIK
jgi:hypothetical protein